MPVIISESSESGGEAEEKKNPVEKTKVETPISRTPAKEAKKVLSATATKL